MRLFDDDDDDVGDENAQALQDLLAAGRAGGAQPDARTQALAFTAFSTPGQLVNLFRIVRAAASEGDDRAASWLQQHLSACLRRSLPAAAVASLLSQGRDAVSTPGCRSAALVHSGQALATAVAKPGRARSGGSWLSARVASW